MTLTLESIHAQLNDFFLSQFREPEGSPTVFRFGKYGSVLSDKDFAHPDRPELGYVPNLAREKFSDLVNHIPIDADDGVNVVLSDSLIDDAYFFRLLTPSQPFFPPGSNAAARQAVLDAFNAAKGAALAAWNRVAVESSSGLRLQYRPSLATPEDWYDKSSKDGWTEHSMDIRESNSAPARGPATPLWRLRLSDEELSRVANPLPMARPAFDEVIKPEVRLVAEGPAVQRAQPFGPAAITRNQPLSTRLARVRGPRPLGGLAAASLEQANFSQKFNCLTISKRLALLRAIGESATTRHTETSHFAISFEYCLITTRRPWYLAAFIDSDSWQLPGAKKGDLSARGSADSLSLLPVALVAVRNLVIEADWTDEDIVSASRASHFGPFSVSAEIVDNKLSRPGFQVVGWILQKMQALPPNDSHTTR